MNPSAARAEREDEAGGGAPEHATSALSSVTTSVHVCASGSAPSLSRSKEASSTPGLAPPYLSVSALMNQELLSSYLFIRGEGSRRRTGWRGAATTN